MIENNISVQVNNISKRYFNNQNKINSLSELITKNLPWNIATHRKNQKLFPKTYGDLWALKNISFSLEKGEILGIIGHNGAGKSTLLKILSQVVLPTSGEAYMRGSIGSLLETGTGFHPELTGFENIFVSGTILGMTKYNIQEKLEEIIEFSEMKEFIHVPVKNYSSGMLAKLGFSVTSHLSSDIMIVDEVLSVGDAFFQEKSKKKMLQLIKDQEKTILFVSHSEESVKELCTQALMLTKGETMDYGKPEDVFVTYNTYMQKRNF